MVPHRVRKLLSDVGYTLKHNHVAVVFDGIRDLLINDCVKTVVRLCFCRPAEPQHGGVCGLPATLKFSLLLLKLTALVSST